MNDELKKILARVQKMLAIAQDERADPNEAATAASQAEKLMRKYQIDHADVVAASFKESASFETRDSVVAMKRDVGHLPKDVPQWGQWLAVKVSQMHDCHVKIHVALGEKPGSFHRVIRFYGYGPDVEVCKWSFDFLVGVVIKAIRTFQAEGVVARTKVESNSFRLGFVTSLLRSIDRVFAARKAEQESSSAGTALVVAKANAVAAHFGEFGYKAPTKSTTKVDDSAFYVGRERGQKVAVDTRAVASSAKPATGLLSNA